jgi:hypothetical protein
MHTNKGEDLEQKDEGKKIRPEKETRRGTEVLTQGRKDAKCTGKRATPFTPPLTYGT